MALSTAKTNAREGGSAAYADQTAESGLAVDHAGRVPRLLPWTTDSGKPCLLSSDNPAGFVSRLADDMEAAQLAMAADVLEDTRKVLGDRLSTRAAVEYAGIRLIECLADVLRVAESRGLRLAGLRETGDDSATEGDVVAPSGGAP
ncbi:hypothetical protein [Streptomyces sp. NPDC048639]|uniref:hypothetical protein n=1 Tax=Streptomyces sp. NPDC048639 TaxID=3365581 RepID=UPI0037187B5C